MDLTKYVEEAILEEVMQDIMIFFWFNKPIVILAKIISPECPLLPVIWTSPVLTASVLDCCHCFKWWRNLVSLLFLLIPEDFTIRLIRFQCMVSWRLVSSQFFTLQLLWEYLSIFSILCCYSIWRAFSLTERDKKYCFVSILVDDCSQVRSVYEGNSDS